MTLTEPLIVLDALTSELFLKCLICIETGSAPRGHDLKMLFDQLSEATRTRIQGNWDSEVATRRREESLGDIAAGECARHNIEHIAVCHPSRRGSTNEKNAIEIAEAIAALGFGGAVKDTGGTQDGR